IDDYANAAEALTQRRDDGTIRHPGFYVDSVLMPVFLRALTGADFADVDTLPPSAHLATPELHDVLTTWQSMVQSGYAASTFENYDRSIPLQVTFQYALSPSFNAGESDAPAYAGAMLPGDTAGVAALGFGSSSGTANPETAYRLMRYLADD